MAFAWYTPTPVQLFGPVKNADINANLNAIAAAFNAQNAWPRAAGGAYSIPASGSQNILVDLSTVAAGNNITVNLPAAPAVGDPPVRIALVGAGPSSFGTNQSSVLVNPQGNPIYGIVSASGLPALANAGDYASFVWLGGSIGWVYESFGIAPLARNNGAQPWINGGSSSNLFPRSELNFATPGSGPTVGIIGINSPGLYGAITRNGGGDTIFVGSGSEVFNGVAGFYNITTNNIRYLFTCISHNQFTVTT